MNIPYPSHSVRLIIFAEQGSSDSRALQLMGHGSTAHPDFTLSSLNRSPLAYIIKFIYPQPAHNYNYIVLYFITRNATGDPLLVNQAAKVMQIMIENFPSVHLFGRKNLEFFHCITNRELVTDDSQECETIDGYTGERILFHTNNSRVLGEM